MANDTVSANGHEAQSGRWRSAFCAVFAALAGLTAPTAKAEMPPVIEWYLIDLPPIQNTTGELRGQGYTDLIRWRLIAELDGYRHVLRNSNVHRMLHDIKAKPNICNPAFLHTAEREQFMVYADPLHAQFPNGAAALKSSQESVLRDYLDSDGRLDLDALVDDEVGVVAVQAGRSYGPGLDEIIARADQRNQLFVITANRPIETKFGLLAADRALVSLLYPYEYAYVLRNADTVSLYDFLPVKGNVPYTLNHLACSRSPLGVAVIEASNRIIAQERDGYFAAAYRRWLPESLLPLHEAHHLDAFGSPLQPQRFEIQPGDEFIAECMLDGGAWYRGSCQKTDH